MVNAELNYNPYLLETTVKFNGHAPRVNSQIEKYEDKPLADWVHKIPKIFYDEMNGYDFDLNFSGTLADFEKVQETFNDENIPDGAVHLFMKNELEDVDIKDKEVFEFCQWLQTHSNRKFEEYEFFKKNPELLSRSYPYIVLHGNVQGIKIDQVSIEEINNIKELDGTVLTNTPILFCIDESYVENFRKDLNALLVREDVVKNQLFFMFHPNLNASQLERVLIDLGIDHPQIVTRIDDSLVIQYLWNYPVTKYIREAILSFERAFESLHQYLEEENEKGLSTNLAVHTELDNIESKITSLKAADLSFTELDNLNISQDFSQAEQYFVDKIIKWRNHKTKSVGEKEILLAAEDLNNTVANSMNCYQNTVANIFLQIRENICKDLLEKYNVQSVDTSFSSNIVPSSMATIENFPSIVKQLQSLSIVTYEQSRGELIDLFWKPTGKSERIPVKVVTCFYEQWRNKVLEIVVPIIEENIEKNQKILVEFYNNMARDYHSQLCKLIDEQEGLKKAATSKLSVDEQMLQEDNDWLLLFHDKLTHIERG